MNSLPQKLARLELWRNRAYYMVKPLIPQSLRMGIRRWFATRALEQVSESWPIAPGSEATPEGWQGWPGGKKFAIVLTHDVEGRAGVDKCREVAQLEKRLGFRSSFNFIPEGAYRTPPELRAELVADGFEVGIHDLKHDGRLFNSRHRFRRLACEINRYAREWGAAGFRAGFMLHELDWLLDLEIEYDLSTFDTDPFEPQPLGRHTIFPFWISADGQDPGETRQVEARRARGYLEMPYTLPQDSTLFLLLREETPEIWYQKLDWIVQNGGMALVNIHPDYVRGASEGVSASTYPSKFVTDFLEYVKNKYAGEFWNPLPRELARWYRQEHRPTAPEEASSPATSQKPAQSPIAKEGALRGKSAAVLLYSFYPADPRPRRAAEALVEAGARVDLYCLRESEEDPAQECVNGVNVWRLPIRKKRGSKWDYLFQYSRFLMRSAWFLAHRSLRHRYDLVHVHNMPDVLVFAALAPKLRKAVVILDLHDPMPELMTSIYGLSPDHFIVRILRLLERWSIGFADLALTPNITFKTLFVSRSCPPEKMQIVMNSPEEEIFAADVADTGPKQGRPHAEFRVMHHGSIVHRHGIDLLVLAVAKLVERIPGIRLDIYGARTPFLDEVLAIAGELKIADRVHYHGQMAQPQIAEAIRACDVGVVPNRRSAFTEINFPTRLFEYLSMHRPVIAPATTGILDYFGPEELVTFRPGDVEDLAEKIFWVSHSPEAVARSVQKGREVYRNHLWSGEKARFLKEVEAVVGTAA
jgi:glycosyltransferase involved in cell wall biosynthesis